jgi:histidinol dehydrogenase
VETLARAEGLDAHAASITLRLAALDQTDGTPS